MVKRNLVQKQEAILALLCTKNESLSTYVMGLELGYANGQPLDAALIILLNDGYVSSWRDKINFGTEAVYWRVTAKGRDKCRQIGIV